MRFVVLLPVTALALAACHRHHPPPVVTSATCIVCDAPRATGALTADEMDETSGLVAAQIDGVFFAHNDSGDTARFFAFDATGKELARFVYSHSPVLDVEDMARGPCDAAARPQSCLFLGDIGDNFERRDAITVYRTPEPAVLADADVPSDPLSFVYPDGPHNAETLLVHPVTGVLTILTKVKSGASNLYEAPMPLVPGVVAVLKKVGTLAAPAGSPRFTGGSVRPAGTGVLLRTYTNTFFAPMQPGMSVAAALAAPLCSLLTADEEQGEAVAWTRSGDGFVTVSEGKGARVNASRCYPPSPAARSSPASAPPATPAAASTPARAP
jgi:hypothetical protein